MKRSNNKKMQGDTAILYERISRDDNLDGDSYSIASQKKLLTKIAKEMGYTHLIHFYDDGISGVTMNRPGFQNMLRELEAGRAAAVFVKDLSRLGRNYIEVGRLTEEFFPEHNIRLVAVSDGIDSDEGESDLAPIRNLFNEWYSRDISKKRRISNKVRGNSGEPMGQPPYGYQKDPNNTKRWIIDPDAASVVKRIYAMVLDGHGTDQIVSALERDHVLSPVAYWLSKGVLRPGKTQDPANAHWHSGTIIKMLSRREYCGDLVNFKTYSKSYKNKKRIENTEENMRVFRDAHEAIIDRTTWEKVQEKRKNLRKRRCSDGEVNMFSGLLVCADCGSPLHFHFNQANHDIRYFNCSNYNSPRGSCPSTHYIRVDFLEQVVLGEIRRLTKYASHYENDFVKAVMGRSKQTHAEECQSRRKRLETLISRDTELDKLFERLYEDNVNGKITDERFRRLGANYEQEQAELCERIKEVKADLEKYSQQADTTDTFIAAVRKYTRARKLTPRMLNELVQNIEVHQAERIDGVQVQRLTIHYNCVGTLAIPSEEALAMPKVLVETRKGVRLTYRPAETLAQKTNVLTGL